MNPFGIMFASLSFLSSDQFYLATLSQEWLVISHTVVKPASFCGPIMIYFKKTYAELKKKCLNLSKPCAFSTDGEALSIDAL